DPSQSLLTRTSPPPEQATLNPVFKRSPNSACGRPVAPSQRRMVPPWQPAARRSPRGGQAIASLPGVVTSYTSFPVASHTWTLQGEGPPTANRVPSGWKARQAAAHAALSRLSSFQPPIAYTTTVPSP